MRSTRLKSILCSALCLASASSAIAAPTKYQLRHEVPGQIKFTVDAPLDSIVGVSQALSGSIEYDPETDTGTGQIIATLRAFTTGLSLRDEDLRERFFEVEEHPKAELRIQRLLPGRGGASRIAAGTLALHGVEHSVMIPIELAHRVLDGRRVLSAAGNFDVSLADYNIRRPSVLFVKLGDAAKVAFRATFFAVEDETPAFVSASPTMAGASLFKAGEFHPVARPSRVRAKPRHVYPASTPEGRGERLLSDAKIGGDGNALTCLSCHSVKDERGGLRVSGHVPPSRTLFDSAKRPSLWQGLAKSPGKAASLCAKLFMLRPTSLTATEERDFDVYLAKISPDDAVPSIDYGVTAMTRRSGIHDPTGGNHKLGARLTDVYCGQCHGLGRMRPPLTVGLYEPDYLVRRVRWLEGHDARQMPPFYVDRLTDSDLRHIVTHLAGTDAQRVFDRISTRERADNGT